MSEGIRLKMSCYHGNCTLRSNLHYFPLYKHFLKKRRIDKFAWQQCIAREQYTAMEFNFSLFYRKWLAEWQTFQIDMWLEFVTLFWLEVALDRQTAALHSCDSDRCWHVALTCSIIFTSYALTSKPAESSKWTGFTKCNNVWQFHV